MKSLLITGALALALSSGFAEAQGTIRGAEQGAAEGTNAAGPVGGIVGGAVGAAAGTVGGVLGVGAAPARTVTTAPARTGCSTRSVSRKEGVTGDKVKKTVSNC